MYEKLSFGLEDFREDFLHKFFRKFSKDLH